MLWKIRQNYENFMKFLKNFCRMFREILFAKFSSIIFMFYFFITLLSL